ncbi:hypothetical protein ACFV4N_38255 [Actinosynnema sp. NPDC059797]
MRRALGVVVLLDLDRARSAILKPVVRGDERGWWLRLDDAVAAVPGLVG